MIDRSIKGFPLSKKEKEKIETILECYKLWSSSENWDEFVTYVEEKKQGKLGR
jgi:hypothetical protein